MRTEMSVSVSFRDFFKSTGLALTALVFLGSVEFSTSLGSRDCEAPTRVTNISQLPAVSGDLLGETEEESNNEARTAVHLLTAIVFLPESVPRRGYLLPEPTGIRPSFQKNLAHPRGPPSA